MRRLATALEVQPSALYWHFPNKQSLLAELSDRIVGRMASGPAVDLVREAHALRDALLAYRDGAEVVSSTLAMGLGSSVAVERLSSAVVDAGFDAGTARRVATTVLHYVLGFVWHEQQRLQYDSAGARPDLAAASGLADAGLDRTAARSGSAAADSGIAAAGSAGAPAGLAGDDFAFGLELIVAGLRARV